MIRKLIIISTVFMGIWLFYDLQGKALGGRMMVLDSVTEKSILTVRKSTDQGQVSGLSLYLFGKLDGTAMVRVSDKAGTANSYRVGPGRVSLKAGGDWSGDTCLVVYEPQGVQSGNLALRYRFKASKQRNG